MLYKKQTGVPCIAVVAGKIRLSDFLPDNFRQNKKKFRNFPFWRI